MKNKILVLVPFIISLVSNGLMAQEHIDTLLNDKIAYLYFYRSKQIGGCGNRIGIQINDIKIQRLKNGRRLIIEYNKLNKPIIIKSYNIINCLTAYSTLKINPEGGKIYYIEVNWDKIYDKERKNKLQVGGLGINFILKDENKGKSEFYDKKSFKDKKIQKRKGLVSNVSR